MTKVLLAGLLAVSSLAFAGNGSSKTKAKAAVRTTCAPAGSATCNPAACKPLTAAGIPGCAPKSCSPACKK